MGLEYGNNWGEMMLYYIQHPSTSLVFDKGKIGYNWMLVKYRDIKKKCIVGSIMGDIEA